MTRSQPAKRALRDAGISQRAAAKHMGYSMQYVHEVLNAFKPASPRITAALSELLDRPASELIDPVIGARRVRGYDDDA